MQACTSLVPRKEAYNCNIKLFQTLNSDIMDYLYNQGKRQQDVFVNSTLQLKSNSERFLQVSMPTDVVTCVNALMELSCSRLARVHNEKEHRIYHWEIQVPGQYSMQ